MSVAHTGGSYGETLLAGGVFVVHKGLGRSGLIVVLGEQQGYGAVQDCRDLPCSPSLRLSDAGFESADRAPVYVSEPRELGSTHAVQGAEHAQRRCRNAPVFGVLFDPCHNNPGATCKLVHLTSVAMTVS